MTKGRRFTRGEDEMSITRRTFTDAEVAASDAVTCKCGHHVALHGPAGCRGFAAPCHCRLTHAE
jgi:hypothetical protein